MNYRLRRMVEAGRLIKVKESFKIAKINPSDKPCPRGYTHNMASGRCINRRKDLGKAVVAARKATAVVKECTSKKGKAGITNPATGRCVTSKNMYNAIHTANNHPQRSKQPKWFLEHHGQGK